MPRYALVIGIDKYDNFTNLPKAVNDAEKIAQLLREHGRFDVQPLPGKLIEGENRWQVTPDKKLTGKELGQTLRTFLLEKAKGSEALIYFAGHGFEALSLTGEPEGFLATSDCNKADGQNAIASLLNIAGDDPKQRQQLSKLLDGEAGLVKGRLLVTGKDEKGEAWIDLAHEALIESWQQFAQWRQKDRDLRRLSHRLADTRREWLNKRQDDKYLMQGGLLAEVRDSWQQLQPNLQSPQEDEDFYQRSDAYEKDRIAELERALTESQLREKAARVENLLTLQPLDSLILAIQAMGENQEKLPQQILAPVQHSLNRAMNKARVSIPFRGDEGDVRSVAISADGQTIVSGGRDGTVRLWNLQGLPLTEPLRGHEGLVLSVAISADGQTIVSGGKDGTVRLWRADWRAWLQVCCDRLRYHPIFTNPQTEEAKAACEFCRKYVWSKEEAKSGD